jgi:RNA polymerase sigma factor for flagellar operon FliA
MAIRTDNPTIDRAGATGLDNLENRTTPGMTTGEATATLSTRPTIAQAEAAMAEVEADDAAEEAEAVAAAPAGPAMSEEVIALWRAYRAEPDSVSLRNRLIERYLPLVRYNAERVWQKLPEGVDLNDLMSAGVFGLMDAIDAFDLDRGVKFETYCVPRIRGAMLDELRTMDWVPRLVRSKASKLEAARKAAEAEFGRPPADAEIAARMQLTLEEFDKLKSEASAVGLVSLNKKWYETDSYKDVREIDILEDQKGEDPTRGLQKRDLMKLVTKGLNRNERLIIILYYYEELTMKEIGQTLGLSESRVSQMHSSIVARLKDQLRRRRPEFG